MRTRVVITGIGVVSGNGDNQIDFENACIKGKSGIKKCTAFSTEGLCTPYFGQADIAQNENRFLALLKKSAEEMMTDAGICKEAFSAMGNDCRMFLGSLLYSSDAYYHHSLAKQKGEDEDTLAHMNDYSSFAREVTGVRGPVQVSSAACASGTTSVGMALEYIRSGVCSCAVIGGVDSLSIIAAYGFHALKSMSESICNPYDQNRDGINIGECGAFMFLETLEHAEKRGAKIYCEVAGYALGNDAYHITSPEPEGNGAYITMKAALKDAGIDPKELDYINGHGTGTRINDDMELKAIERLCAEQKKVIPVSSTKALTGHCMGASGTIELASVIFAMRKKKYLPMPNLKEKLTDSEKVILEAEAFDLDIKYALSNSFAFAGNSASIVIAQYNGGEAK